MLDADEAKLTRFGTVTIGAKNSNCHIIVEGFSGEGCGCREVAALALVWAIGELQRELMETLERPGGGNVGVA